MNKLILMICTFLFLSFNCYSNECDEFKNELISKIKFIDLTLDEYEHAGAEYSLSFDYHVGFLKGKREAYMNIFNQL